jgi:16S rRNA (cytosine1402-N4)-methyltransferase
MAEHVKRVDRALFDLGFSSAHVDDASRGFSFMHDGPLDMRYDTDQELTAAMIVNSWPKDELARLMRKYGEEPRAHRIADAIFLARKKERITRTVQLADIVCSVVPRFGKRHPATTLFQALRIAVNDEFGELEIAFKALEEVMVPGGKVAFLTFHSIEDRIVKQWLKGSELFEQDTKKPLAPTRDEIKSNPRARSAKLRIATRI